MYFHILQDLSLTIGNRFEFFRWLARPKFSQQQYYNLLCELNLVYGIANNRSSYKNCDASMYKCMCSTQHPLQVACQGVLKYCLRDMLGQNQRDSLFLLFDVISDVLSEVHDISELEDLDERVHTALAFLERDFPRCVQVFMYGGL